MACRTHRSGSSLLLLTALLAACSSTPTPPAGGDGGGVNKDATPGDGSVADTGADAGFRDTGPMIACDPVSGDGCPDPKACVFVNQMIGSQCRDLAAMPKTHEQPCDAAAQDCAKGFTCVALDAMTSACLKTCSDQNGAACDGLMGASMNGYACNIGLQGTDVRLCGPRLDTCTVLNDMCMAGEYCELVGMTDRGCVPEGPSMRGASCSPQALCKKGNVCINLGGGGACTQPCNTRGMPSGCAMDSRCVGLQNLEFGVCFPGCNPAQPTCAQGTDCEVFSQEGAVCASVPANAPSTAGTPCTQGCQGNLTCINGVCRVPCDAQTACAMGMCAMLQGLNFGICM